MQIVAELKAYLDRKPNTPILSMDMVKNQIVKFSSPEAVSYATTIKSDMEVYCGFFLVVMVFMGGANFVSVVMFWQMQRMRYMMNMNTQLAFSRLDVKIVQWLTYAPPIVGSTYGTIKGYLGGMVDV